MAEPNASSDSEIGARPGRGWAAVALSALFHCLVLGSYFCLRPVREAMGVQGAFWNLYWLFGCTLVVMVLASVVYAWATTRVSRRVFIPASYGFFMLNLLGFAALLWWAPDAVDVRIGWAFFVWLSVFNMFVLSVFWSFMSDGWLLEESKRAYPIVAVGGTVGALGGAALSGALVGSIGPVGLMLVAIGLLGGALGCFLALDIGWFRTARDPDPETPKVVDAEWPIKGRALSGLTRLARSRYLLGIAGYIGLMTIANTFLYFTRSELIADTSDELEARVQLFAYIDTLQQGLTLVAQLLVTGALLRRLGVGVVLGIAPVVVALGFTALAIWETYAVVAVFSALYGMSRHAFARPARETLFTVVSREDKYRAKNMIDTVVYRGGDVVGMGAQAAIALALGVAGLALAAAPMAVVWVGLGVWLARSQAARRTIGGSDDGTATDGPQPAAASG
ncbi:MAG: MFS transporter [Planctomycetota bacterium]